MSTRTTLVETSKTGYLVRYPDGRTKKLPRRFRFTKAAVESLPHMDDESQLMCRDSDMTGLWLRVGKTRKSYLVQAGSSGCETASSTHTMRWTLTSSGM